MGDLVIVALAGFFAAMVDGALGMGFGPTSSSLLLSTGISPGAVSTSVNLAKVVTGVVAGAAHWRLRNIDRRLVAQLAIPGAVGALIGVTVLANVNGDAIRPYLAVLLALVGVRILVRFSMPITARPAAYPVVVDRSQTKGASAAGAVGGVTNGLIGAWGPVVTPYLLHRGVAPRYVVGCVNTAEIAVALVATGSLLTMLGGDELRWDVIAAMLLGGVAAAPLAAYVVRFVPPRLLGLAVAGLLLLTQARELATTRDLPGNRWLGYALVIVAVVLAGLRPRLAERRRRPAPDDHVPVAAEER